MKKNINYRHIVDKLYSKIWTKDVKICFWKPIIEFILCRDSIDNNDYFEIQKYWLKYFEWNHALNELVTKF